jgi:hypothetical protein
LQDIPATFATTSSTIFCASSEEMLCFFTTLAIGQLPPLDIHCVLIIPALRAFVAAFPVLQDHLAEMAVPASRRLNCGCFAAATKACSQIVVASPGFTPG